MDRTMLVAAGYRARSKQTPIEQLGVTELTDSLTFTGRESYLEWVSEWKKDYAALSETIRGTKRACKNMQRAGDPKASHLQADLAHKGFEARLLCRLRHVAKAYSWELREASRQEPLAM